MIQTKEQANFELLEKRVVWETGCYCWGIMFLSNGMIAAIFLNFVQSLELKIRLSLGLSFCMVFGIMFLFLHSKAPKKKPNTIY